MAYDNFYAPSNASSNWHPSVVHYGEHTKGARPSTRDKHTSTRSGSNYGENRNNKRGDNNKKYKKPANPNKKKTEIACGKDGFKDGILEAD